MILEREVSTYRRALPQLLAEEGKYVLIQGDLIAGIFATRADALEAGYDRFGLSTPFLVHQIRADEKPVWMRHELFHRCPS